MNQAEVKADTVLHPRCIYQMYIPGILITVLFLSKLLLITYEIGLSCNKETEKKSSYSSQQSSSSTSPGRFVPSEFSGESAISSLALIHSPSLPLEEHGIKRIPMGILVWCHPMRSLRSLFPLSKYSAFGETDIRDTETSYSTCPSCYPLFLTRHY